MLPTPPAAPVTKTSFSPGTTPCRSNSITHCIAVNPAVPIAIACFSVIPRGSRTSHFASTRASSAYPPQAVSDNPNPVITTSSPSLPLRRRRLLHHARQVNPRNHRKLADHPRPPRDREAIFIIQVRIPHPHQHIARRECCRGPDFEGKP